MVDMRCIESGELHSVCDVKLSAFIQAVFGLHFKSVFFHRTNGAERICVNQNQFT